MLCTWELFFDKIPAKKKRAAGGQRGQRRGRSQHRLRLCLLLLAERQKLVGGQKKHKLPSQRTSSGSQTLGTFTRIRSSVRSSLHVEQKAFFFSLLLLLHWVQYTKQTQTKRFFYASEAVSRGVPQGGNEGVDDE